MSAPRYSYTAINNLALNDTGRFCYLDAWTLNACLSIIAQSSALYLWANDQNPLTEAEIDDLKNKLATTQGQLMQPIVGLIIPVCTAAIPDGTLLCDGSTYARSDYPNLYDALDTFYRLDAASFFVPDLRDRFILGSGPAHAVNDSGGSFEHVQSASELAAHTHTTQPHTHTEITATPTIVSIGLEPPVPSALPGAGLTGASVVIVDSTGGSAPMDITPPYLALRYVVVAL